MVKTVWFVVMTMFNPNVGDGGETMVQQQMLTPHRTDTLRSYDECKSQLYKLMERSPSLEWKMRTSYYKDSEQLILVNNSTPPNVNLQYTCEPFKIDMKVSEGIK